MNNKESVSIILNCHNESLYVNATLKSLELAVADAQKNGISVELILVLDKPTIDLLTVIENYPFRKNLTVRTYCVNNASVGLSRNEGIKASNGNFILICDGDDLISSNTISQSLDESLTFYSKHKKYACFMPEFCYSFGLTKTLTKFYPSNCFAPSDFLAYHPFCSRIFCHRSIFERIEFDDLSSKSGFAFEDWEFTSELILRDIPIEPAKGTILFYRQRPGSIMHSTDYVRVPKLKKLSNVDNFLKLSRQYVRNPKINTFFKEDILKLFTSNEDFKKILFESNELDPSLDVSLAKESFSSIYKNIDVIHQHWGYLYSKLLNLTGGTTFDDIYLLPWLIPGGGDKYFLQIIKSINKLDSSRNQLIITLENRRNTWITNLPDNCLLIDFYRLTQSLSLNDQNLLLMRFLIGISKTDANLHVKSGIFSKQFLEKYGKTISKFLHIYKYTFCINQYKEDNRLIKDSREIQSLREEIAFVEKFINDNNKIVQFSIELFGENFKDKFVPPIYAYVEDSLPSKRLTHTKSKKILWASRICKQKRVELLDLLAYKIKSIDPELVIEVYGSCDDYLPFKQNSNIKYKGSYSNLKEINLSEYFTFLYTSYFDGVPNIILEMLASGVPVIAPVGDLFAIGEVITFKTGWPVQHVDDDNLMVENYITIIKEMLKAPSEVLARSNNGIDLIKKQHSELIHLSRVKQVFSIPSIDDSKTTSNPSFKEILQRAITSYLSLINIDKNFKSKISNTENSYTFENYKYIISLFDQSSYSSDFDKLQSIKQKIKRHKIIFLISKRIYNVYFIKNFLNKFFIR